jgi:internalin A
MLSDAAITKATGQYDKEVVARLRLECMGIQHITNLDTCFALIDLSLSRNAIGSIAGLDFCTGLRRLDLSYNKIRKIEGLDALLSLDFLNLRANCISSVNELDALRSLPQLQTLFLQDSDGTNANPGKRKPPHNSSAHCQHTANTHARARVLT